MSHPVQPEAEAPQPDPLPDPQARVQELEIQLAAERAAHEFDVPAALLAAAQSAEDIDRIASSALLWRAETAPQPPPPQTGAVSVDMVTAGTGVLGPADRMSQRYATIQTRDSLSRMSPAEILAAWKSSALSGIGVGAPQANGQTPMTRRNDD
jgi:hypothetical protein